jgi:hypothetical protein
VINTKARIKQNCKTEERAIATEQTQETTNIRQQNTP